MSHMMKRKQRPTSTSSSQAKKTKPTLKTSPVPALQELLDFSQVKTEEGSIERRLNQIAKTLLHEFRLVVVKDTTEETEFEILEAEFYLQIDGCHEDPFTHGSEEQKTSGEWYFHRPPRKSANSLHSSTSPTGYRGGSRKGLDLTIGGALPVSSRYFAPVPPISNPPKLHPESRDQQPLFGGILLRSLYQLGPNRKIISGPSLLVDCIVSASGASSIADLVENKWAGDTRAFISGTDERSTRLFFRPVPSPPSSSGASSRIYFSPRIGLDLSHPGTTNSAILPLHPRIQFLSKSYRFFTQPENLIANGRPQTFLGVLLLCISTNSDIAEGLEKPFLYQEIAALMALKESTSVKYLADYIAGREGGVDLLNSFVGPKGKGASSSPSSYLRMMGALSNLVSPL